jgi:hypothetical protein
MKMIVSLMAAGVIALAMPAMASNAETTVWFLGEDFQGNQIIQQLSGAPDHAAACGGTAPLVTSCTTGVHVMTTGTGLGHGVVLTCTTIPGNPTDCFFGRMTSQVSDGVNTRTFNCNILTPYQLPVLGIACAGVGSFPTTTFTHNGAASGYQGALPAAIGDWGAQVLFHSP